MNRPLKVERALEAIGNLVNAGEIYEIHPSEMPTVEKIDIPDYIFCQNFERSKERAERSMERYKSRVDDLLLRLGQSESDIKDLERNLRRVDPGDPPTKPGGLLGPSETPENIRSYNQEVEVYNDRLQQARRLKERISDAVDRHRDIVDRHNDAVREAEEKLEELMAEAVLAIDDDIVAVLDQLTQIAKRLANSEESENLIQAVEVCFIQFKVFNLFEGHIESNDTRRMAQEQFYEANVLCAELIVNEKVRWIFSAIFGANGLRIVENAKLYDQVVEEAKGVDQEKLNELTEAFLAIFKKQFYTDFKYEGIIDPAKLDSVVAEMHDTIDAIRDHIPKVNELDTSTQVTAEAAVVVHESIESTLAAMKTNIEEAQDYLLSKGDLLCQMMDEMIIEDFFDRNLSQIVTALRKEIIDEIGWEQFDAIVTEAEDRYSIEKAEAAIKEANLPRLQSQRDQASKYVNKLSQQIKGLEGDITKAGEVPKKNADAFRSSVSLLYVLSCFPVLGFVFALVIMNKVKKFAPAFRSPLDVYHKLGTEILAKNKTMLTVVLILGAVLGVGGIALFFGIGIGVQIGASMGISPILANVGFPGGVLILYLISWAILSSAGNTLQSYIGKSQTQT